MCLLIWALILKGLTQWWKAKHCAGALRGGEKKSRGWGSGHLAPYLLVTIHEQMGGSFFSANNKTQHLLSGDRSPGTVLNELGKDLFHPQNNYFNYIITCYSIISPFIETETEAQRSKEICPVTELARSGRAKIFTQTSLPKNRGFHHYPVRENVPWWRNILCDSWELEIWLIWLRSSIFNFVWTKRILCRLMQSIYEVLSSFNIFKFNTLQLSLRYRWKDRSRGQVLKTRGSLMRSLGLVSASC